MFRERTLLGDANSTTGNKSLSQSIKDFDEIRLTNRDCDLQLLEPFTGTTGYYCCCGALGRDGTSMYPAPVRCTFSNDKTVSPADRYTYLEHNQSSPKVSWWCEPKSSGQYKRVGKIYGYTQNDTLLYRAETGLYCGNEITLLGNLNSYDIIKFVLGTRDDEAKCVHFIRCPNTDSSYFCLPAFIQPLNTAGNLLQTFIACHLDGWNKIVLDNKAVYNNHGWTNSYSYTSNLTYNYSTDAQYAQTIRAVYGNKISK